MAATLLKSIAISKPGNPKKYTCLIKSEIENKGEIIKNGEFLDNQSDKQSFDTLVSIFCSHLTGIWMTSKSDIRILKIVQNVQAMAYQGK